MSQDQNAEERPFIDAFGNTQEAIKLAWAIGDALGWDFEWKASALVARIRALMRTNAEADRYFAEHNNPGRKCPNSGCAGTLEYISSTVREGERCPACHYFAFGRK